MTRALGDMQHRFQRYVLDGDGAIAAEIAGKDDTTRNVRLGIYSNAYRLRLIEVLSNDFEALRAYVGQERFDAIARAYIAATPSPFRNVRWYGGGLADFLRHDARYRTEPMVEELARFEWTLGLAFDAADAAALDFSALAAVAPEDWADLRFMLHPSLHILPFEWNVIEVWQAIQDRQTLPAVARAPATVVVWRRDYQSRFRLPAADEAQMLEMVGAGQSFGELCEALEIVHGENAPARAAQLLQGWVAEGWLVKRAPEGEG